MKPCFCGHLKEWAENPDIPVTYHPATDRYSFDASPHVSIERRICCFCGGRGWPHETQDVPPCRCGWLSQSAQDPESPVRFHAEINEFNLHTEDFCWCIYFCAACGGRAPESHRDKFFTKVSDADHSEINKILVGDDHSPRSIAEIVELLGEPDERYGPMLGTSQTLTYRSKWTTADVHVQEHKDGRISLSLHGKYIGPGSERQTQ